MPWCHAEYAYSDSEAWVKSSIESYRSRTEFEFVIESEAGRALGCCGLNKIDPINRRCNLGYWVRSSETNRDIATRAVLALADWAYRSTDLVRLEIVVAVSNVASLRVAEKSAARREGTLRSRLLLHGKFHDAVLYSLVKEGPAGA